MPGRSNLSRQRARTDESMTGIHQNTPFAPDQLLGAIVAPFSSHTGRLHRLTVHTARTWLGIAAQRHPQLFAQDRMDPLQGTITPPFSEG